MEEKNAYVDAETYQGKAEELTFRLVLMEHLRRISQLSCTEFTGGYWNEVISKNGITNRTYVPATHEAYSNAIGTMADLLSPYFDKEMMQKETLLTEELEYKGKLIERTNKSESEKTNEYKIVRAFVYRSLFRELCRFLFRKNYLESAMFTENAE